MKEKTLGERMKEYELVTDTKLINKLPVVIRLDGRAFHTFTKGFKKPFDDTLNNIMGKTMLFLCENITNCIFGYTQSDEITLVLYNPKIDSEPWFDNRLEKIVSTSASLATLMFNKLLLDVQDINPNKLFKATFDARAFNLPLFEVVNNIIWRQQDAVKNSINSVAQANFSHKQLQGKNGSQMQDMLMLEKGVNWNDTPTKYKRGMACIRKLTDVETPNGIIKRNKWVIDEEMPIITQNREYVENLLYKEN